MKTKWMLHVFALGAAALIVGQVAWPTGEAAWSRVRESFFWLGISYLPGYFVYTLVVAIPRQQDIRKMEVFISKRTRNLVGDARSLMGHLQESAGNTKDWPIKTGEIRTICSQIDPNSKAPLVISTNPIQYANWMQLLFHYKSRSESFAEQLLKYLPYLEAEHVRLITDLRHCTLFSMLGLMPKGLSNKDMSFLADPIQEYHDVAVELERYQEQVFESKAFS